MKKITLLLLLSILSLTINSQTILWSSDASDYENFPNIDSDGDGHNWEVHIDSYEYLGFNPGPSFFSASYDNIEENPRPLTPDNLLVTPIIAVPSNAKTITYKMKVAALDPNDFEEKFAVLVFDDDDIEAGEFLIYEEILTEGGEGTAKEISVTLEIELAFAGKNIRFYVRHYDCTDELALIVDDFEVSYSTTLSTEDTLQEKISIYPNTVKDIVTINTKKAISAITITNNLGQKIKEIEQKDILNNTINLNDLSKGMYFMTIKIDNKLQSFKILKQ
ncbi:T9SS type A sorting domain-containing protein [uncultured Polaribacter sp.]|uniref:T9SS type A sorting domain-containing protein n=1 Tax=uncultured Polaribacter sp. TaxID=174711 RepID=UPI0026168A58|nr:T9SS type A sorting domain-containing protein [uncultured Polaribacter sp.]